MVPEMVLWRVALVSFILATKPVWDRRLEDDVVKVAAPEEHSDPLPDTGDEARGDQMSWKQKKLEKN